MGLYGVKFIFPRGFNLSYKMSYDLHREVISKENLNKMYLPVDVSLGKVLNITLFFLYPIILTFDLLPKTIKLQ